MKNKFILCKTNALVCLLSLLVFCSCGSTKVTLNKETYKDTIELKKYKIGDFWSAFATLNLEKAAEFATTPTQKQATDGLNYALQNEYDSAATIFMAALKQKDTVDDF